VRCGLTEKEDGDEWVWINVGSAVDAEVRLPWADAQHLSIYPSSYNFLVAVHSQKGMRVRGVFTEEQSLRLPHPNGWRVWVRDGSPMTIMGHEIRAMKC
jgi:hypothetical protein